MSTTYHPELYVWYQRAFVQIEMQTAYSKYEPQLPIPFPTMIIFILMCGTCSSSTVFLS